MVWNYLTTQSSKRPLHPKIPHNQLRVARTALKVAHNPLKVAHDPLKVAHSDRPLDFQVADTLRPVNALNPSGMAPLHLAAAAGADRVAKAGRLFYSVFPNGTRNLPKNRTQAINTFVYIYVYIYVVCVYVCMYMYVYIYMAPPPPEPHLLSRCPLSLSLYIHIYIYISMYRPSSHEPHICLM